MELKVEAMACGGCVKSVTKAIQSVDADARVEADLAARAVRIETSAARAAILQALEKAGYPATAR
jgi:copper chaperone